jgi:hypothetical protein
VNLTMTDIRTFVNVTMHPSTTIIRKIKK